MLDRGRNKEGAMKRIIVAAAVCTLVSGCAGMQQKGGGLSDPDSYTLYIKVWDRTALGNSRCVIYVGLQDPVSGKLVYQETPWLLKQLGFDYHLRTVRKLVHEQLWLRYKNSGYIPLHEVDEWTGDWISYGMPVATSEWRKEGNHYTATGFVPSTRHKVTRDDHLERYGRESLRLRKYKELVLISAEDITIPIE